MKKTHTILLGISCLLLCSVLWCNPVHATSDWSDDFEDGNYDGWTVIQGDFSVIGGELTGTTNGPGDSHASIYRESNVTLGTWSFDVNIPSAGSYGWVPVAFMAESTSHLTDVYYVVEWYSGDMWLSRYNDLSQVIIESYDLPDNHHWGLHHVSVVRNSTNDFYVYLNGSLVIEGISIVPAVDFEYFVFYSYYDSAGVSIDNITVTEYVEPIPTPTETPTETPSETPTTGNGTPPPIDSTLLIAGVGAAVVVVVVIAIVLKRRS